MSYGYKESQTAGFPDIGFSLAGGKSRRLFRVTIDETEDLQTFITDFVGGTSLDVGDGRMQRTPPIADPQFPWMMCSQVNLKPVHGIPVEDTADDTLEVPTVPEFGNFVYWDAVVEFQPRKFPVVQDSSVGLVETNWYPDVNTDSTSTLQTFTYADETVRYTTDPIFTNQFEFVSAQQGNMKFVTNNTSFGGFNPNAKAFPAKLKMTLPNMGVKVTTMAVPYRYFTSSRSYITGGTQRAPWQGRVNQNAVTIAGYTFPRGSLQYVGFDCELFTPPVPELDLFFPGVYSTEKLMNLTLMFNYTLRTATDRPADPSNKNYITYGHNLLPWTVTRKFHYAQTASGMPAWPSAPLELLWTDPDFVQNVG